MGHPFKGGWVLPQGYLQHPDMKRFSIATPILFAPPNPIKMPHAAAAPMQTPSFAQFFNAYFVGANYDFGNSACGKMMRSMKACYENNASAGRRDPV